MPSHPMRRDACRRPARSRAALSPAAIRELATDYGRNAAPLEALVRRLRGKRPAAAPAATQSDDSRVHLRRRWTKAEDEFLRAAWGRQLATEIAGRLGRTLTAVQLRKKRLGISTRDFEDLTIRDIETLTKIDHRQLHRFIEWGWLRAWQQPRTNASPVTRVSVASFLGLLRTHPEVYDVSKASRYVRGVLELFRLPPPPKFKRVVCRSRSWTDGNRPTPAGPNHHAEARLRLVTHRYSMPSCGEIGGTPFYAPLYEASPICPRCGCITTRYSEDGVFADEDPGEHLSLNAIAGKLGLRWNGSVFTDANGRQINDEDLVKYVFHTKRAPSRAFRVFRRLLQNGIALSGTKPIEEDQLLPDILGIELREDQAASFDELKRAGRVGVYSPPSLGKTTLGCYAMTRLPGRHVLFVPTATVAEVWIHALRKLAPAVEVRKVCKPHFRHEVRVFDHARQQRCLIDIYNYRTREPFANVRYRLACFDEAHWLPGNTAHTLLYKLSADHRLSVTASPWREDGREDVIQLVSGAAIGENWQHYRQRGDIPDVAVKVIVVEDPDAKFRLVASLCRKGRSLIYVEAIADGIRLQRELGVPFVHGMTANRLRVLSEHRVVAVSRVGDCGISLPDVEQVIELSFLKGARAQSIQRHGRLLHSGACAKAHTVLMTRDEFSRHLKRLSVLEARGCRITIQLHTGRPGRPARTTPHALTHRPMATWCDMLRLPA